MHTVIDTCTIQFRCMTWCLTDVTDIHCQSRRITTKLHRESPEDYIALAQQRSDESREISVSAVYFQGLKSVLSQPSQRLMHNTFTQPIASEMKIRSCQILEPVIFKVWSHLRGLCDLQLCSCMPLIELKKCRLNLTYMSTTLEMQL